MSKASAVPTSDDTVISVPTENPTNQDMDATSDTSTQEGNASETPLVLPDDLQRIHDKLSTSSRLFYNKLSNEDRFEYLTSVRDVLRDETRIY
ncbi:4527_t:CDS:2, partial [Funneliformis geosporum]